MEITSARDYSLAQDNFLLRQTLQIFALSSCLSLCCEWNVFPKILYSVNVTLSRLVVFGGGAFSLEGDEVMRVEPLLWD